MRTLTNVLCALAAAVVITDVDRAFAELGQPYLGVSRLMISGLGFAGLAYFVLRAKRATK